MSKELTRDQFVLGTIQRAGIVDALAYIVKPLPDGLPALPDGSHFEVVFLRDHKPNASADPIRVLKAEAMEPATEDQVLAKKREWEIANNHHLPFQTVKKGSKVLIE